MALNKGLNTKQMHAATLQLYSNNNTLPKHLQDEKNPIIKIALSHNGFTPRQKIKLGGSH